MRSKEKEKEIVLYFWKILGHHTLLTSLRIIDPEEGQSSLLRLTCEVHHIQKPSDQGSMGHPHSLFHPLSLKYFTEYQLCARHWAY